MNKGAEEERESGKKGDRNLLPKHPEGQWLQTRISNGISAITPTPSCNPLGT